MTTAPRPLRADAARNRARVLQVAYETFAAEGMAVPVDEIARRAGVGAGTVYRHFPTKDDLIRAVVDDRFARLAEHGERLLAEAGPWPALAAFIGEVARAGASDLALKEAVAAPDLDTGCAPFRDVLDRLVARAAPELRPGITGEDVFALLVGGHAMVRYRGAEHTERLLGLLLDGLRAP
ncbi:AcrR family transcriptional regulator [Crossiella equi]|uniref:AcrR family transcriptional regulator n=1 Tax=Crossiella equi TaxID=130796 RepID=A0ABS5A9Z1_9PSEU|nr:TetR/AcrR family transcriptional regulator [Crossiella equi]MBP2473097.1 AcrR family transcriptional regulator [Crossiella equi]